MRWTGNRTRVVEIQKKVRLPGFPSGQGSAGSGQAALRGRHPPGRARKAGPALLQARGRKDHLEVVGTPNITDVHFHAGEPITFKAEFEVAPDFELKRISRHHRHLRRARSRPTKTSPSGIEEIREQKAEYVNEEPRPLADGDYAVVSLESLSGVAEKVSQDELMLQDRRRSDHAGVHRKPARRIARRIAGVRRHLSGRLRPQDSWPARPCVSRPR